MWYCSPAGEREGRKPLFQNLDQMSQNTLSFTSRLYCFPGHNNTMVNKSCNVTVNVVFFCTTRYLEKVLYFQFFNTLITLLLLL